MFHVWKTVKELGLGSLLLFLPIFALTIAKRFTFLTNTFNLTKLELRDKVRTLSRKLTIDVEATICWKAHFMYIAPLSRTYRWINIYTGSLF